MSTPLQVLVFGHKLSPQSLEFLKRESEAKGGQTVRVINYNVHIEKFCNVQAEVFEMFKTLEDQYDVDLSGRTRTIMTAPASSVAAMTICGAWKAITGNMPEILNLIKDPAQSGYHVPSPECPTVDLASLAASTRQKLRARQNGVEVL